MSHTETVLTLFMILGVIASSAAGALRAIEARMDITGAILLAFLAANAGGTSRDLILGCQVFWITHNYFIWLSFLTGVLVFSVRFLKKSLLTHQLTVKSLQIADAMGLAAFSIAGVEKALTFGQGPAIAVLMGVMTAVGGGIAADVVANRPPAVFSSELYITVSLVGSIAYLFLFDWIGGSLASLLAIGMMVLFRMLALSLKLKFST